MEPRWSADTASAPAPTCVVTSPQARKASTSQRWSHVDFQSPSKPAHASRRPPPHTSVACSPACTCLPARAQLMPACTCAADACLHVRGRATPPSADMRAPGARTGFQSPTEHSLSPPFVCLAVSRHFLTFQGWGRQRCVFLRPHAGGESPREQRVLATNPRVADAERAARPVLPPLDTRAIARPMLPPQLLRIAGQHLEESRQTVVVLFLKLLDLTPSPPHHSHSAPSFVFARATQSASLANRRVTLHTYGLPFRDSAFWLEPRRGPYVLGVYQTRP